MRIAQLAPLVETVPPKGYGGTELVVSLLTDELVRRGHEVTLFAAGDAKTTANLVSVVPAALRLSREIPVRRWSAYAIRSLLELEKRQNQFDIVHNHMGYDALPYLQGLPCATVTTNHNPIKEYCAPIYLHFQGLNYVSISDAYRRLNYCDRLNYVATVYNGIDLKCFDYRNGNARSYLLFIGRLCPEKGTLEAIQIARRLGLPLKIAGKIDDADRDYYEQRLKSCIDGSSVEYVGEVGSKEKSQLYSQATAVVYPIAFDEPFGLVMAESLACGTPVMALDRGSVREVLSDGETAVVAGSSEELIERFPEIRTMSSQSCRKRAESLFSKERMADHYELLYEKLCG